jgi:hypothetical protein
MSENGTQIGAGRLSGKYRLIGSSGRAGLIWLEGVEPSWLPRQRFPWRRIAGCY